MTRPHSQAGFSLVELALSIVAMGIVAAVLTQVVPALRRSSTDAASVRNMSDVETALLAFAAINGRLPCPDTNNDGVEDSGHCVAVGTIPYATLGFSAPVLNAVGLPYKYGVYLNAGSSLRDNAQLTVNTERYAPSIGSVSSGTDVSLSDKSFLTSNRRLDFCQALRAGMSQGIDTSFLYVETRGVGSVRKHVPYVLVDPGVGNMDLMDDQFDGYNSSASAANPRFEAPSRAQSLLYDDHVTVGYFDQMWERLGCSANMATAGRALPNVETTVALLKQSLSDYRDQLDLAKDIAFEENFSAGAGIADATAGVAASAADMVTDIAAAINTAGATSGAAVSAGIAIGLSATALGVAIANQVLAAQVYSDFQQQLSDFDTMVNNKFNPLYTDVKANVQKAGERVYSNK